MSDTKPTRKHRCPWCRTSREAPESVLAHPWDNYTVTCDCGKAYSYNYYIQKAWKLRPGPTDKRFKQR